MHRQLSLGRLETPLRGLFSRQLYTRSHAGVSERLPGQGFRQQR